MKNNNPLEEYLKNIETEKYTQKIETNEEKFKKEEPILINSILKNLKKISNEEILNKARNKLKEIVVEKQIINQETIDKNIFIKEFEDL
jgi:hypothetical protein